MPLVSVGDELAAHRRAEEIFATDRVAVFRRTDRLFAGLMGFQWVAAVCTAPFWLDAMDGVPHDVRLALAFLALLQVTAAILNFLPVPGLDGYGMVEPWLSYGVRRQVEPFAPFGLLFVFALVWVPEVNQVFFDVINAILRELGISDIDSYCGSEMYRFWQTDDMCSIVG